MQSKNDNETSIRMAKIKKKNPLTVQNAGEDIELVGLWYTAGGNANDSHSGKYFSILLYDLYDPAIPHLGTYHSGIKTYVHKCLK